jgi:hypothetical protein
MSSCDFYRVQFVPKDPANFYVKFTWDPAGIDNAAVAQQDPLTDDPANLLMEFRAITDTGTGLYFWIGGTGSDIGSGIDEYGPEESLLHSVNEPFSHSNTEKQSFKMEVRNKKASILRLVDGVWENIVSTEEDLQVDGDFSDACTLRVLDMFYGLALYPCLCDIVVGVPDDDLPAPAVKKPSNLWWILALLFGAIMFYGGSLIFAVSLFARTRAIRQ